MRALTLTGAVALVALAGACTKPVHVDGQAQPAGTAPTVTSSPTATPSTATPVVASSSPSATPATTKASTRSTDPCPVSSKTLLTVLRKEMGKGTPDGLTRPSCTQGYAYARATYVKEVQHESAWFLFKFTPASGSWRKLNAGTASVCEGYAPQSVSDYFSEEGRGGC